MRHSSKDKSSLVHTSVVFGLENMFDHEVLQSLDELPKVTLSPMLLSHESSEHVTKSSDSLPPIQRRRRPQ